MDQLFDGSLETPTLVLLFGSLAIALGFEFVNGFHDTANAVATVIYTNSLRPKPAVIWSGICNFLGVYLGGTAVAFSIVRLLPVDLLVEIGSSAGIAMVLALLTAAILWNLGTWYLAIPASSSHTLIGSILGVGLAHSGLYGRFGSGVNWAEAGKVGLSLLLSPLIGFALAAGLFLLLRRLIDDPRLYAEPPKDTPPPAWVRATLIGTCTGVSLAHGSNDGQKGIGLVMLILIGVLPASYALDPAAGPDRIARAVEAAKRLDAMVEQSGNTAPDVGAVREGLAEVVADLEGATSLRDLPRDRRWEVRTDILRIDDLLGVLHDDEQLVFAGPEHERAEGYRRELRGLIYYAPTWVMIAVALSLGLGTMIGWERIVVTVGEKIGKSHLTYAQGAAAELVAMTTIGLADFGGLPVSTTHVLSSGVAGTMAANRSGLQLETVRNIALAWLLTLPASMLLSSGFFLAFLSIARAFE